MSQMALFGAQVFAINKGRALLRTYFRSLAPGLALSFVTCSPSGESAGSLLGPAAATLHSRRGQEEAFSLCPHPALRAEAGVLAGPAEGALGPPPPPLTPWTSRPAVPGGSSLLRSQLVGAERAHDLPQVCAGRPALTSGTLGKPRAQPLFAVALKRIRGCLQVPRSLEQGRGVRCSLPPGARGSKATAFSSTNADSPRPATGARSCLRLPCGRPQKPAPGGLLTTLLAVWLLGKNTGFQVKGRF